MSKLTTERLEEMKSNVFSLKSISEAEQIAMIDELLSLRLRTDAGDEEVQKILDELLPVLPSGFPAGENKRLLLKLADYTAAYCQQLREAREEIERLKDNLMVSKIFIDGISKHIECSATLENSGNWSSYCQTVANNYTLRMTEACELRDTLTAERDEARKEVEALKTTDKSNAAMSDRCNRVLRVLRDASNPDAESAFWIIAGEARDGRETIARLTAELAALKSCPEMGEVDALVAKEDSLSAKMSAGHYLLFINACDIARRAIASHAQEKQRADEAERLLKWWVNFKDGFGQLEGISAGSAVSEWKENAAKILAICGKGDG